MRELLYFLGRSVCHQIPERSFFIYGHKMPLCARCTGIYLGMFLSFMYLILRKRFKGNKPPSIKVLFIMAIFWIPLMIDGVTSYVGIRETNNIIRFITGLLFGVFMPVFVILLKNFNVKKENLICIIKNYKDLLYMILTLILGGIVIVEHSIIWWIVSVVTVFTILYLYIQIIFIIIKQLVSNINKKVAYIIAFTISTMIISGLSIVNKIILEQYR